MKKYTKYLFRVILTLCTTFAVACGGSDNESPEPTPTPTPTPTNNSVEYRGRKTELKSAGFTYTIDPDLGAYYTVVFSPKEGIDSFEGLLYADNIIFFQIDEERLLNSDSSKIDLMGISPSNVIYMLVAAYENVNITDSSYNRDITSGEVKLEVVDGVKRYADIELEVVDLNGETLKLTGRAPYLEYEQFDPNDLTENFIRYDINDRLTSKAIEAPFYQLTEEGVIYTLAAGDINTYARLEDTAHFKFFIEGKSLDEDFSIDLSNPDRAFEFTIYDPVKAFNYKFTSEDNQFLSGKIEMKDGVIDCSILYDSPVVESTDVEISVNYNRKAFRGINEVNRIINLKRTLALIPRSVVYDRSGEEHKIYISSRENITTVEEMSDAEIIIAYPSQYGETLEKGNFVSGSLTSELKITFEGTTYKRGAAGINGLNVCLPEWDKSTNHFVITSEVYATDNAHVGMALYYDGKYISIE